MYNNYNMMRNSYTRGNNVNDFMDSSYFFDNNFMNNISNMPNNSYNQNFKMTNPTDGYSRGNLFSDLYSQYKNYDPRKLASNDPKMKLWLEMSENFFAAHEINLYLDINPNDQSMIELFNDYRKKADNLKKEYESKYGPLCLSSDELNQYPFLWVKNSFPWEGGNN